MNAIGQPHFTKPAAAYTVMESVMGLEQRDRIRWLPSRDNWKQEDAMNATDKPFNNEWRVYLMGAV